MLSEAAPIRLIPLSGEGYAALASLRVEGRGGYELVSQFFRPLGSRAWSRCQTGHLAFGHWERDDGEEIVVSLPEADVVEIHCHGGLISRGQLMRPLLAAGCQLIGWEDWFTECPGDPIETAAKIALCKAKTKRVAMILVDQLGGVLRNAIEKILSQLKEGNIPTAVAILENLLGNATFGTHLLSGWRVLLLGHPNVGKSSLFNGLLGFPRSIVLSEPGTTRDLVTATTALEGWPIELIDTAGVRSQGEALERSGMELALQEAATADLVLLVSDASQAWTREEEEWLCQFPNTLVVHNKHDLTHSHVGRRPEGLETVAVTSAGLDTLCSQIVERAIGALPEEGAAVPHTAEQATALEAALERLRVGMSVEAAQLLADTLLGKNEAVAPYT